MKLLLDENLSYKLATLLCDEYPDSTHVMLNKKVTNKKVTEGFNFANKKVTEGFNFEQFDCF
jgi:predicted nuclease of predicted toxin-antitoxin system